jgi:dihydrofolate reductase
MLPKILFYPAVTLDGFIATANGDSSWVTAEDEQLFTEEVQKAGCVIVGSKTFQQYKDIIYPVPNAITFVCSSKIEPGKTTHNSTVRYLNGPVAVVLKEIEKAGFTTAVLSGGGDTNGRFAEAQAIDQMIVSIYPCTIGSGIRMFGEKRITTQLTLTHTSSQELGGGVIRNRYKVQL